MVNFPDRFIPLALGFCLAVTPVSAQEISGRVVDHGTGQALANVRLMLLTPDRSVRDETLSNRRGGFTLTPPTPGEWMVSAELIGYGAVVSEPMTIAAGERVEIEIRLSVEPVPVEGVVVTGRRLERTPDIQAFYDRVERGRRSGIGDFVTRDEVERAAPFQTSDLLRLMPGIQVVSPSGHAGSSAHVRMGRGCTPAIYVDGSQINHSGIPTSLDNIVPVSDIEGIEVYRGAGRQVGSYYDDRGCGLILVWTRRGTEATSPFSWAKILVGASLVIGLLLLR